MKMSLALVAGDKHPPANARNTSGDDRATPTRRHTRATAKIGSTRHERSAGDARSAPDSMSHNVEPVSRCRNPFSVLRRAATAPQAVGVLFGRQHSNQVHRLATLC